LKRTWLNRLAIGLMPAAALVVHELRYLLAYGGRADHQLAEQGHAYLSSVIPWAMVGVALALGGFLVRLARAWSRREAEEPARHHPLLALWLATAVALLAVYAGQEFLEGLFATGHPTGLIGAFGGGGLWAIPAALVVGALIALALRGQEAAIAHIVRVRRRLRIPSAGRDLRWRSVLMFTARVRPLATSAAGRAPPL
jgi:hypothetical protein